MNYFGLGYPLAETEIIVWNFWTIVIEYGAGIQGVCCTITFLLIKNDYWQVWQSNFPATSYLPTIKGTSSPLWAKCGSQGPWFLVALNCTVSAVIIIGKRVMKPIKVVQIKAVWSYICYVARVWQDADESVGSGCSDSAK